MEAGDLLALACVLAPVIDHRAARPLTLWSLSLAKARQVIVPAIAGTWPLLQGWPQALEGLLACVSISMQKPAAMATTVRAIVFSLGSETVICLSP